MFSALTRYLFVSFSALAIVFLLFTFSPRSPSIDEKYTHCQAASSAKCLTDWGLEKALTTKTLPRRMREVTWLARMGRFEDAHALEVRVEVGKGSPPETAQADADRRIASHKLASAIRSGLSLDEAVGDSPEVDAGVLWITGLDLLDRNPYGAAHRPEKLPDESILEVINEIALQIEAFARDEADRPKTSHLVYAAELFSALYDRGAALGALRQIPKTEDARIRMSVDLITVVGVETALEIYHEAGGSSPHFLLNAAAAEESVERAEELFEEAFVAFSLETPWPDFSFMHRTVERAAEQEYSDLSLRLAREMARQAETTPASFPVFGHIYAARALSAADAPDEEIRESIDMDLGLFPDDPSKLMGFGLVSGPILWGKSGLETEARRGIANLLARIGELEEASRLMEGLENPVFSWNDMLTSEIPAEHFDELLLAASETLNVHELAYVRAQLSAEIFRKDVSAAHREWAVLTAREIAEGELVSGERAVWTYASVLRVAQKAGRSGLREVAFNRIAEAAITSGSYTDLIQAGLEWHVGIHD